MLHDFLMKIGRREIFFHVFVANYHAHDLKPLTAIHNGRVFSFFKMHLIIGHHFKLSCTGRAGSELSGGTLAGGVPNMGALQTVKFGA
ncbi:hypothetical protein D3C85_1543700 [compost metagenome]